MPSQIVQKIGTERLVAYNFNDYITAAWFFSRPPCGGLDHRVGNVSEHFQRLWSVPPITDKKVVYRTPPVLEIKAVDKSDEREHGGADCASS